MNSIHLNFLVEGGVPPSPGRPLIFPSLDPRKVIHNLLMKYICIKKKKSFIHIKSENVHRTIAQFLIINLSVSGDGLSQLGPGCLTMSSLRRSSPFYIYVLWYLCNVCEEEHILDKFKRHKLYHFQNGDLQSNYINIVHKNEQF